MIDLTARRTALLAYAQSCLASEDWHGLWDCAIDLHALDQRMAGQAEAERVPIELVGRYTPTDQLPPFEPVIFGARSPAGNP